MSSEGRRPTALFPAAFALVGLALGARPLGDNSTFIHLRVGLDVLAGLGIPRRDPYSATALGEPWTVQSWLPATAYGLASKVAGGGGLLVLMGLVAAALALVVHHLSDAGTPLRTLAAALVAVAVGGPWWSPRPLLVGLVCLGLTIHVARSGRPALLVPIWWVWINSHGSFPLGAVWLVLWAAGGALEARRLPRERLQVLGWAALGAAVACVNPLGPRLLLFPATLGEHREVFRLIVEWRPADFQSPGGLVTAAGLATCLLVASRRRVPLDVVLPAAAFAALGLVAQRNLAPLGVVLAPLLGAALSRPEPAEPPAGLRPRSSRADRLLGVGVGAAALVIVANALSHGALDLRDYPVQVVRDAERMGIFGPDRLVAAPDIVGGYLVLRRGRQARVFIDDRYDMYPVPVTRDYVALLRDDPRAVEVLDARRVDAVLWQRDRPLATTLAGRGWQEAAGDRSWVLLRRPA